MDLFSYEKHKYKLPSTVRLFKAFSGIGTQAMALKRITKVEHVGFSEIDKYAIKAYKAIHGDVPNYGDITKMTEIPPCDVFTWSFPCTDLSKAGKQKGLQGTRSGLGFEVMRLLHATKDKPKVLLMENVPDLLSPKFRDGWHEMYNEIESLGYTNYVEVLNAKNYGVAQNRERVFMVSILGDYAYSFPKPFKLEKRLKDYLEDEVDEKYYLSDKQLKAITNPKFESASAERIPRENDIAPTVKAFSGGGNEPKIAYALTSREFASRGWMDEAPTLTARDYKDPKVILEPQCFDSKVNGKQPSLQDRIYDAESISTAVTTSFTPNISVREDTKQGYAIAEDGDGVYINRPHQKRGVVQKDMIQTIKAGCNDIGVVVEEHKNVLNAYNEFVNEKGYIPKYFNPYNKNEIIDIAPTVTTLSDRWQSSGTISIYQKMRIRKLTPREAGRLMDFEEWCIDILLNTVSNSQAYKIEGNAIVVNVLVEIFRGMI